MDKKPATVFASALFASTILASLLSATPAVAQNRIFYVDHLLGSDSADGLSPATAWKHAPGDSRAPAKIYRLELQAGDQVRFRGGVRYRGSITPRTHGTKENPVVFDGSSWGAMRAIFDGSDPLTGVRRCQSAADCLGNPNWKYLWRANFPADRQWTDYLFVNDEVYQVAQYPDLPLEESDKPDSFLPIPLAELSRLQSGQIRTALPAGLNTGNPTLALWVNPNVISFNPNIAVSTTGVTFNPADSWMNAPFKPYTDRSSAFSLMNVPQMVSRPGLFAASDSVVIFWPRSTAAEGGVRAPGSFMPAANVGGRRLGINTSRAENILIRGFSFTSYSGEPGNMSQGTAVLARGQLPGITIAHNNFQSIINLGGPAAVHMIFARDLTIAHNSIADTPWTAGIKVDNSHGPVLVKCNTIMRTGGSGIRFLNVKDGSMLGNRVSQINSVHGNALTAYRDLRNVLIAGNVVTDAIRPLTVHGVGNSKPYFSDGIQSVAVINNVLIGNQSVNGAITSYNDTPNLTISGNFLYSQPYALKITGKESGFSASGNQLVGGVVQPKDNQIFNPANNISHDPQGNGAALVEQMSKATPPAAYCN